ncbi:MAG TPA: 30S ribosomal protein S5 [Candidatus Yonathbacteria bacterium]|uniref:Small ribosomal subunit protein uS5 n=1 Tax=Candidatus Nomurabacteria bacterium GW2011_GWC2_42_20 TaxID=1618756 RepID=A0A0G1BPG7_9BACT|nr:MAG: 30S ribosomal protein S5 [Candidatus Nomurabacteria bacterium GW2011_GWC2_42_20]KKT07972.1 MAG: 30S ribosomal protein S5 [Candidatus Nomurabacteria bacterium GW2011_GWB1_43_20]TAN37150.1 MAG: 30S ribosomal protein S5 [Patescibacteria group bacterium]HBH71542.1 30S ribosomal protein S5 [Candidatus Yonathbacteria bacterium]
MTETTQKSLRPSRESADSETTAQVAPVTTTKTGTSSARPSFGGARGASSSRGPARGGAGARKGGSPRGGRGGAGFERVKPEFDNKLIQIRRVTRVVAGGRRFAFSVALVAGNRKGSVGVGIGKASDTALAIEKATKNAKKNMIKVLLTSGMMIPHEVEAKESSATVMIMPAKGRGMVAGSSVRNVLELAGIKDVRAKILSGSKNKLNNARATIKALEQLRAKAGIASKVATVEKANS